MTPLGQMIAARIATSRPMRIDEYMALCLGHPEHGYYMTRDPLGVAGDFTTAPEISQMFGEMLGGWMAQVWLDQGAPGEFVLAELGPGRGTLMRDALRVAGRLAGFAQAARLWLVETSPVLRAAQGAALADHAPRWAGAMGDLPEAPLILIANEFFDALPTRQFQRVDALWRERLVGAGPEGGLGFVWGQARGDAELSARFGFAADGALVEVCAAGEAIAAQIGGRIARQGGAALMVDYGAWEGSGDTLQALRGHEPVDPLETPGEADLTTHPRFRPLVEAAGADSRAQGPIGQGAFLERLGITERARALARGKEPGALEAIIAAHRRLTHPEEMGNLFQVLALHSRAAPPTPGFES